MRTDTRASAHFSSSLLRASVAAIASALLVLVAAACGDDRGTTDSPGCTPGTVNCVCAAGMMCNPGLVCRPGNMCVDPTAPPDSGTEPPPVTPNPEAFWADDPPPMQCLEDGTMGPLPDPPGGTPECPDDKNREGCRCDDIGGTAPCWPGLRANRNRGQCRDGTTTCNVFDEFTGTWGPCMGYVLPTEGATLGPASCRCFSAGRWEIDNLSPCFAGYDCTGMDVSTCGSLYAVSTYIDAGGQAQCPSRSAGETPPPTPEPGTDWSTNRLTVDCEGQFELCYTLKAGNADTPAPSDCVVARTCTSAWYATRDVPQEFPPLPSWTGMDPTCARQFHDVGGYGEMSVIGQSIECDAIDDGTGSEYVFNRVNYCPTRCNTDPSLPECMNCMQGGSGSF